MLSTRGKLHDPILAVSAVYHRIIGGTKTSYTKRLVLSERTASQLSIAAQIAPVLANLREAWHMSDRSVVVLIVDDRQTIGREREQNAEDEIS